MAQDKDQKTLNVPPLRFPGFTDEWKETAIGEAVRIGNGRDYKHLENGDIPVFGTGGYMTSVNDYLFDGETVFIGRKGTIDKPFYYSGKFWTVDTLFYTFDFKSILPKFLLNVFHRINWKLFNEASGVPSLSKATIEKIKIKYPSLPEQEKISSLLSLIDERIATQNKIIEDLKKLKSAISVKLLHCDSWNLYKIKDIATLGRGRVISSQEISQQNNPKYPVYSSQTSNDGIMGYLDDYMYNGEYISWTTDGANAGTVFYRNGKFNCTNVCGLLKLREGFDTHFVSLVLSDTTKKYVSTNLANPKLMNNTMGDIQIRLPKLFEQKRLSVVFCKLQEMLTVNSLILVNYTQQKQYLLSKLFI